MCDVPSRKSTSWCNQNFFGVSAISRRVSCVLSPSPLEAIDAGLEQLDLVEYQCTHTWYMASQARCPACSVLSRENLLVFLPTWRTYTDTSEFYHELKVPTAVNIIGFECKVRMTFMCVRYASHITHDPRGTRIYVLFHRL